MRRFRENNRTVRLGVFTLALFSCGCRDASDVAGVYPPPGANFDRELAFVSTRDGSPYIYVANLDGSGVRRLTPGERPAWAWDGRRIVYHRWSGGAVGSGRLEIRAINSDGTGDRLLGAGLNPAWSPDGKTIVFNTGSGTPGGGIFAISADGSGLTRLISSEFVNSGDYIGSPTWSPDGRSIAFIRANYEEPWQIYIMNADGSNPRRLITGNFIPAQSEPAWSPTGSEIAFESFGDITTVNADGSGLRLRSTGRGFDPDWSPYGGILFNKYVAGSCQPPACPMRIFFLNTQDGLVRQLIPEAVDPALVNYWDYQVATNRFIAWWDY